MFNRSQYIWTLHTHSMDFVTVLYHKNDAVSPAMNLMLFPSCRVSEHQVKAANLVLFRPFLVKIIPLKILLERLASWEVELNV